MDSTKREYLGWTYEEIAEHIIEIVDVAIRDVAGPANSWLTISPEDQRLFREAFAFDGHGTAACLRIRGRSFVEVEVDISRGRGEVKASHWSGASDDPTAIADRALALNAAAVVMTRIGLCLETLDTEEV